MKDTLTMQAVADAKRLIQFFQDNGWGPARANNAVQPLALLLGAAIEADNLTVGEAIDACEAAADTVPDVSNFS